MADIKNRRTIAKHGVTAEEINRFSGAGHHMETHLQRTGFGQLWFMTTARGSSRKSISEIHKRITRLQAERDFFKYSAWCFETRGGLHAHSIFIGNAAIIQTMKQSAFGPSIKIKRVYDLDGLVLKYLAKERTPQAGWGRERQLGGRIVGSHKLEGGGDRVHMSRELERDATEAGLVESWDHSNAKRKADSIRRAFDQIKLAQPSTASVLFVGEAGVGKQHLARVLHYQSPLGKRAFVPLDCRRAATEDLEATLTRMRDDQQADVLRTGAVYFDFIDAAPADFQSRLIEWLATNTGPHAARVLAGSTRPLEPLVEAESFSRELYFALTTLVVEVTPLRDRREDLEPLAQHFLEELNRSATQQVGGLTDDVWRQFRRYNWPGNVTELRAVIEESRAVCSAPLIAAEHLPFRFKAGVGAQSVGPSIRPRPEPLDPLLERIEREQIELALVESRQNKARAAELLGITRPRLYRRMELLGIIDLEPKPDAAEPSNEDDAPVR